VSAGPDRRLLRESSAARMHLAVAGGLGVLSAALIVAQAALLAGLIDRAALQHATPRVLHGQLIALLAVLLARAGVNGGFELSGRLGATRVMSQLRGRLAHQLLILRPGGLGSGTRTGELAAAAVQGVDALEVYFAGYLPQLILATLVPLAVLAWTASIDPIAAGVLAVTIPILICFMVLIGQGARAQTRKRWQVLSLLSAHFLDVVRGLPTLRAYRREQAQSEILAGVGERYRAETMATLRVAFLSALVLELCAMIGTALVAATIGVQLIDGTLGLTAGLTVLLLAPELYGPLRGVGQQFHASNDGTAAAERIVAVLEQPATIVAAVTRTRSHPAQMPDPAREMLALDDVGFAYPQRPTAALAHVELELVPGQITALVGPSGAGKSTIAKLLMRLAEPSNGAVRCGGVDLRELDAEHWRRQIAWVPQRAQLFAGTIAENVRLGAPDANDVQLAAALRAAGAGEFVEALPLGLDTPIGEVGRRLSAGQRQRIALSRAFLRDARLLVLDEPTANLDEENIEQIGRSLELLAHGRTTLLIVHHPALAERADRVVTLRRGRIEHEQSGALAHLPALEVSA